MPDLADAEASRLLADVAGLRAEAALAGQGAYDETDLRQLVARTPPDEPAVALLVRVLAAQGRDADALEVFETLRTELAERYGTGPSPVVADVDVALLRGAGPRRAGPGAPDPRNLKLAANGRVVLLDFGLARASVELTHAGYTLRYAPLEQVRGQATDARADLFALGATLYELLGRRSPVDAVERASALSRGEADPLAPLRALAPSVPESVAEVVAHALALHPHQRPATARAMRVALDEAVNGPVTVLIEAVPVRIRNRHRPVAPSRFSLPS